MQTNNNELNILNNKNKPSQEEKKELKDKIITYTWERDSHGLFDYENTNYYTQYFDPENKFLLRNNNENLNNKIILSSLENESFQTLCKVKILNNNKIFLSTKIEQDLPINTNTLNALQEKIWYVIRPSYHDYKHRFNSSYEYELKKNDILKLGRIKFIVKELNIVEGNSESSIETFIPYEVNNNQNIENQEKCRICYSTDNTEDNPMISVCKCKGSMNLHFECLKLWLNSQLIKTDFKGQLGVSYTVKKFNCELCHEPYPLTIKIKNKLCNLLNYVIPEGQNYVVLQSLNSIKENEYPLNIHVLMFIENETNYTLGRGHDSDIRISDISVSRNHARIFMKNRKYYMEDMNSKFGTLVLAKNDVGLSNHNIFQIGRTLVFLGKEKKPETEIQKFKKYFENVDIE